MVIKLSNEEMRECIIEQILFTEHDIDTIKHKFFTTFNYEKPRLLHQIWQQVIDEMPELN